MNIYIVTTSFGETLCDHYVETEIEARELIADFLMIDPDDVHVDDMKHARGWFEHHTTGYQDFLITKLTKQTTKTAVWSPDGMVKL